MQPIFAYARVDSIVVSFFAHATVEFRPFSQSLPERQRGRGVNMFIFYMPKTRKLKGIETAGAVLILIIVVAVAVALWYVINGMLASTSAPNIQINPYNSTIVGNQVWLTIKFGTAAQNPGVEIRNPTNPTTPISGCSTRLNRYVTPGESVTFILNGCTLERGRQYIVIVSYDAGGRRYNQTLYWQPWP